MPDPVWYYARGEVEKGPLSSAQIKALAAAGKIRPDDYVWKEGMDNWLPASDVQELFPADTSPIKSKESEKGSAQEEKAAESGRAEKFRGGPEPTSGRPHVVPLNFEQLTRWGSRLALLIGILAVVLARGCDSIGIRSAARLKAMATSAERRFQAEWDERRQALEVERTELENISSRSPAQEKDLRDVTSKLADLQQQMLSEESRLRATRWNQMEAEASLAIDNNTMWGFWRELMFQFGSIVLAIGLVGVAYTSDGPERWICLVTLAVVVYSIFRVPDA